MSSGVLLGADTGAETGAVPPAADPGWPADGGIDEVAARLRVLPAVVEFEDCAELRAHLAEVASGDRHVVQGGDCAELFAEVSAHTTRRKAAQLADLAQLVGDRTGLPTSTIGRIAGQFAKPRSHPTENVAGFGQLPVYRGDAVNGLAADPDLRRPDPRRLLTAHVMSSRILQYLDEERRAGGPRIFTSHEALLLDYEIPLIRAVGDTSYASSAHMLWIGERTRAADGAHVRALANVANPLAVKLGPTATESDVLDLVRALDPEREPGRLTFVTRLGAGGVEDALPALVRAAAKAGATPVWICDPMHGNTRKAADGRKTRLLPDIVGEIGDFVRVLRRLGAHPAGLHLELTPDDVTECAYDAASAMPRYWSGCDPRLNPEQARQAFAVFAEESA